MKDLEEQHPGIVEQLLLQRLSQKLLFTLYDPQQDEDKKLDLKFFLECFNETKIVRSKNYIDGTWSMEQSGYQGRRMIEIIDQFAKVDKLNVTNWID